MTQVRLSALLLEDSEDDARLVTFELEASGFDLVYERVTNEAEFRARLARSPRRRHRRLHVTVAQRPESICASCESSGPTSRSSS